MSKLCTGPTVRPQTRFSAVTWQADTTCRDTAGMNKDSRAVLLCGSPMCGSYPQTPAHGAGKDHECCRGSPQYATFQTLVLEPCIGVRSMGPGWGLGMTWRLNSALDHHLGVQAGMANPGL